MNQYEGAICPECGDAALNLWGFCESCGCDCEELWENSKDEWEDLKKTKIGREAENFGRDDRQC